MTEQTRETATHRRTRGLVASARRFSSDEIFEISATAVASVIIVLLSVTAFILVSGAIPILQALGIKFIIGIESYEALPYILGTLVTAAIAMTVGVPVSLGIAVFLAEMCPAGIRGLLSQVIEVLAAVPSVIYGFWGVFVFRYWVVDLIEKPLSSTFGSIPIFQGTLLGLDILTAGLILAIMIIPTVSAISKEVMMSVPSTQREAAYSLGATKWEAVRIGVLSYARSGIFGATILGLGRAVGETMAVTMVIGNALGPAALPTSLFKPGQTMASLIANQFNEADFGSLQLSALIGVGLVLFMIAIAINVFAQFMVWKVLRVRGGTVE